MEDDFEEEEELLSKPDYDEVVQRVCHNIDPINGTIQELKYGEAKVLLETSAKMVTDKSGLVHSGNIFSSAAYASLLAVNHPNGIVIGSEVKFLAPIELGNQITFAAKTLQEDTKKREVKVEGFVLDIKVFDAIFYIAVFEKHVLSLHITRELNKQMG
ncbi:MAG: hypothetical protein J1E31_06925 [Helicobacter sp.]|nr:hypothetical protein [Helicobacter sp.]